MHCKPVIHASFNIFFRSFCSGTVGQGSGIATAGVQLTDTAWIQLSGPGISIFHMSKVWPKKNFF